MNVRPIVLFASTAIMVAWGSLETARGQGPVARLYAPRVVSADRADAYSLRTFAEFPRWRDLKGDARAWEIYQYLADPRSGLFHMNVASEGDDVLEEFRHVRDPIKIINVYGFGYCGILGPVMAGVAEGAEIGPARTVVLPAWGHVASETFYDDRWHYLDLDVRAAFREPSGRLASLSEARTEPKLWRQRGPLFFPKDDLNATRKVYSETAVDHYYGFHQTGHTLDYVLRSGDRFTRWYQPQEGRWHQPPSALQESWLRDLLEESPRGPKPNHRDFSVHNHGNGCFVYEPNLTSRSADFRNGAYDQQNIRQTEAGLTLAEDGSGYAVFEIRSPYIIVPKVNKLDTPEDDREASVVEFDASGTELALSLDNGITWKAIAAKAGQPCDLSVEVAGRYGYLLKLSLSGNPKTPIVRRLKLTTWVQVAPAALPSLRRGKNTLEFRSGDHFGLATRVMEIQSQAHRPEELLKHLVSRPDDYDPSRKTSRIRGTATARVVAPPGTKIQWLAIDASFQTHQREAAVNTRNSISYATAEDGRFEEIYRARMPIDVSHWHTHASCEVRLVQPVKQAFVRFHGVPALNAFTIYAHCIEDVPPQSAPVTITHVWREGSARRQRSVQLAAPGPYVIEVDQEPDNESLELAVSSQPL